MSTTTTSVKLTQEEIIFQQRVKSVELAIKSQGRGGISQATLIKIAEEIYKYLKG